MQEERGKVFQIGRSRQGCRAGRADAVVPQVEDGHLLEDGAGGQRLTPSSPMEFHIRSR